MPNLSTTPATPTGPWARAVAAVLCLAVSWIHIQDQGGFPGDKTPLYVGLGYYLLEAAGLVCAALLLLTLRFRSWNAWNAPWWLAVGVALGPLMGYTLSRGPGLPDYSDDQGNWTEPLGLISLAVEAALLFVAVAGILSPGSGSTSPRQGDS